MKIIKVDDKIDVALSKAGISSFLLKPSGCKKRRNWIGCIILLGIVITVMGCRTTLPPPTNYEPPANFFPPGYFAMEAVPDQHEFMIDWYGKHLLALMEPSLYTGRYDQPVYRFLWLRTFNNPWAFRVELFADGTGCMYVKRTNGKGGYEAGRLVKFRKIALNVQQVRRLRELVAAVDFWEIPKRGDIVGVDGAEWVVEVNDGSRYRLVVRWSPVGLANLKKGKEYVALCEYFINIAGAMPKADYYY